MMSLYSRTYYWTAQIAVWLDVLFGAYLFHRERYELAVVMVLCAVVMQLAASICWQAIQRRDL